MRHFLEARLGPHRAGLALVAVSCAAVLIAMDLFVINLAFAAISADFPDSSPQTMSWVINAYAVSFAALLVPAGRLADKYGRRKLFRLGLTVFVVGALGAALSTDVLLLAGARGVQGAGAALFVPTGMALLLASSPPSRHTAMLAIWTAVGSIAAAGGPILGGALTQLHWRWIFLISLPAVTVALVGSLALKETPRTDTRLPDLVGSALLAFGVGALVTALSYVSTWGPADPRLWGILVVAALSLGLFVRRCATRPVPAVNLSLFHEPTFRWATSGIAIYFIGFAILLLGGSLMLTRVWAMDPIRAGLIFSVGPLTAMITSVVAGRLDVPARLLSLVGSLLVAAAGLLWSLLLVSQSISLPIFFAGMLVSGVGAGAGQLGFMSVGASSLPAAEYAAGTGIINTARQIGSALGVAVFVGVVGTSTQVGAFRGAWLAVVVASLVAAVASVAARPALRGASPTGEHAEGPRPASPPVRGLPRSARP